MNAYRMTKSQLADEGLEICFEFLKINKLPGPKQVRLESMRSFLAAKPQGSYGCGAYFPSQRMIWVSPDDCAKPSPGQAMQWSFPGYTVDRTPMGVLAHEFGHFVDYTVMTPEDRSNFLTVHKVERVSSYEPNGSEAFAESMRLFIMNPALLKAVAPRRYTLSAKRLRPVYITDDPLLMLRQRGASDKILAAAARKAGQK